MDELTRTLWRRSVAGERARVALLSGVSFVLGLAFLALLIADEARAAF